MCGNVAAADRSSASNGRSAQPAAGSGVPKPAGEITAVRIGSRVVYRYRDAEGHTVLVDEPPPGYAASKFENMAPPVADAEPVDVTATAPPAAPAKADTLSDRILRWLPRLVGIGVLAVALAWSLRRIVEIGRRTLARRRSVTGVLDRSGYETMHGVILPLSDGRTAFFDHIVRTPSGLLVIGAEREVPDKSHPSNAKEREQAAAADAHEIRREVAKLDARVEAVKVLAPGVPVFGRFVCTGDVPADSSVTRVVPLPGFARALPEFRSHESANADALSAAWHSLRIRAGRDETATQSASATGVDDDRRTVAEDEL
jgi:hypothetical protein